MADRNYEEVFWTLLYHSFLLFLDTVIYQGEIFIEGSILDIKTHFKPKETLQYIHNTSRHPSSVEIGPFAAGVT